MPTLGPRRRPRRAQQVQPFSACFCVLGSGLFPSEKELENPYVKLRIFLRVNRRTPKSQGEIYFGNRLDNAFHVAGPIFGGLRLQFSATAHPHAMATMESGGLPEDVLAEGSGGSAGGPDGSGEAGGAGGAGASGEGEYEVPEEVAMLLAMLGNEHAVRRGKAAW